MPPKSITSRLQMMFSMIPLTFLANLSLSTIALLKKMPFQQFLDMRYFSINKQNLWPLSVPWIQESRRKLPAQKQYWCFLGEGMNMNCFSFSFSLALAAWLWESLGPKRTQEIQEKLGGQRNPFVVFMSFCLSKLCFNLYLFDEWSDPRDGVFGMGWVCDVSPTLFRLSVAEQDVQPWEAEDFSYPEQFVVLDLFYTKLVSAYGRKQ